MSAQRFLVSLTADFRDDAGRLKFPDIGLSVLEGHPHIRQDFFQKHQKEIAPEQIGDAQGVIVLTPNVTAKSVSKPENLLVIARFGVGYDSVDVKACTAADVLVTITTGAVDRPVAEAAIGWMIALSHNVLAKDRLVRTGQWDERSKYMGRELRDRTLGVIGLGGIGRKTIELLGGFGMKQPLAFDPFASEETAAKSGARLVSLVELLEQADFVSIHCPLTENARAHRRAGTCVDEAGRVFAEHRARRHRGRRCIVRGVERAADCRCGAGLFCGGAGDEAVPFRRTG